MAYFERCDESVSAMAKGLLNEFETHRPLIEAGVKIDFLFAYPGDSGTALRLHGCKALGICRVRPLKQRALGLGDAEISLDGEWWEQATEAERRALLDHELHHIMVRKKIEVIMRDDLGRPLLKLRPHDYEFGWFTIIAHRHGLASQERQQSRTMMAKGGQFFWPEVMGVLDQPIKAAPRDGVTMTISTAGMEPITLTPEQLQAAAKRVSRAA